MKANLSGATHDIEIEQSDSETYAQSIELTFTEVSVKNSSQTHVYLDSLQAAALGNQLISFSRYREQVERAARNNQRY